MRLFAAAQTAQAVNERGVNVNLGSSFYRPQSCFSRDLAVLSAVVHRRQQWQHLQQRHEQGAGGNGPPPALPPLHVADLMAGSGIRSMRYLLQAGADHVLCNEGNLANNACLELNLGAAAEAAAHTIATAAGGSGSGNDGGGPAAVLSMLSTATPVGGRQWRLEQQQQEEGGGPVEEGLPLCELTHEEAASLLARCRLEGRFFDLIDSDSFGAAPHCVGAALDAVRYGGLICLTSTAGTIAGGRDPASAVALYGQHLAPVPFANEQGLRMLIGLAHREALSRRLNVTPMWSLYSPHGPVFRAMLHVTRQGRQQQQYKQWHQQERRFGYVLHWPASGESRACAWHDLPGALLAPDPGTAGAAGSSSSSSSGSGSAPPLLSGPLWLGPLHDHQHLQLLHQEAAARGWLQGPGPDAGAAAGVAGSGAVAGTAGTAGTAPVLPATRKGSIGSLGLLMELLLEEAAAEVQGEAAAAAAAAAAAGGEAATAAAAGGETEATAAAGREAEATAAAAGTGLGAGAAAAVAGRGAAGALPAAHCLPPWFIRMNDVSREGHLVGAPSRDALAAELRRRGFLVSRSHVESSGLKTNASMSDAVAAAIGGLGIRSRAADGRVAAAEEGVPVVREE